MQMSTRLAILMPRESRKQLEKLTLELKRKPRRLTRKADGSLRGR